jgi:sugar lactone lactonase YvrE
MLSKFKFIRVNQSVLRVHVCLLTQILVGAMLPATVWAQVSLIGTSASGNFGAQAIGLPSATQTLSISVTSGTTVGSVAVVTTGIANLDFANATGTTCTAKLYSSTTACAVNVTFTPTAAGLRMGAVVFYSKAKNAGTVLKSAPLYGIGIGPQIAYGPGTLLVIDAASFNGRSSTTGLQNPRAVAADAAGNLFILDDDSDPVAYRLVKVPAGGGTPTASDPTVNGEALYLPSCVTVDGAGDLYIGDFYGRVVEVPTGGGAATAIFPAANGIALNYPSGLAVDGAGNLFIADFMNNRVLEIPAGGGAAIAIDPTVNGVPLGNPHGVAVDGAGDLFIADLANSRVIEVPAGGGTATAIDPAVNGVRLESPTDITVDGAGDLFISDGMNHRMVEVPADGSATSIDETLYDQGLGEVYGVAVDGGGDLFIVEGGLEGGHNIVEELQRSTPPALVFPTLTAVGSTDTTDGLQTVEVMNIGNQPLTLTALGYPIDFPEVGGDASACTGSANLSAGQECDVSVEFSASNSGALSEGVALTDNALNVTGAQQSIPAAATGEALAALTSPAPGNVLPGPTVTFTWTASASASRYALLVGSTGLGASNLYNSGKVTVTSRTASGILTNGQTVYVRLTTYFGSVQFSTDYTYTAATLAALTSPVPGAVLQAPSVTFNWTAGTLATGYSMWFGSTGVGSYNLKTTAETTASSIMVTGLPTNGETIYARLITYFNTVLTHIDYVYTAVTPSTLASPAPGAVLPGPSATFNWSADTGATGYSMWFGSTGVGSNNLKTTAESTATSVTVTGLPTNGETIYVRLYTYFNAVSAHMDYAYTAAPAGTPATMVSPASGGTLGTSKVSFSWTVGSDATQYDLWLGLSGPGSSSLYVSGWQTATSTTVASLPAKGATVYARLYSLVYGVTQYIDYTYIEQ